MKINKHGMFNTPESMDVVNKWIEQHPKEQRLSLYTAAYMTWNYLAGQIKMGQENNSETKEKE